MVDYPSSAKFLTPDEKQFIIQRRGNYWSYFRCVCCMTVDIVRQNFRKLTGDVIEGHKYEPRSQTGRCVIHLSEEVNRPPCEGVGIVSCTDIGIGTL